MNPDHRRLPVPFRPGRPGEGAAATGGLKLTAPFAAQLLGQTSGRRGSEDIACVAGEARGAYLRREYSGEGDRRLPPGIFRRTDV